MSQSMCPLFSTALRRLGLGWIVVVFLLAPSGVIAQDAEPAPQVPTWTGRWEPQPRNPGGWDWIRMKSNEWIKGEMVLMRDFDLEFDSDEFGLVTVDWADVSELLTERAYTVVLEDMKTAHVGTIAMRGDQLQILEVGGGVVELDRARILAITPGEVGELRLWTARASAGINLRSGNTDSTELSGRMKLGREGRNTRVGVQYTGAYGSLNDEKNTNNHRGNALFDYFLTRDFFLTPAAFEVFSDEFQNIAYRLTPAAGVGYYFVRHPRLEWQGRLAAGYQHTRNDSAPSGDSKTADNGAINFGTTVDTDITSDIDLILQYQLQLVLPDTEQTNHHTEATLEVEVTSFIDIELTFIWDRIEDPEKDAGGKTPDSDDFRISAGLAIEY